MLFWDSQCPRCCCWQGQTGAQVGSLYSDCVTGCRLHAEVLQAGALGCLSVLLNAWRSPCRHCTGIVKGVPGSARAQPADGSEWQVLYLNVTINFCAVVFSQVWLCINLAVLQAGQVPYDRSDAGQVPAGAHAHCRTCYTGTFCGFFLFIFLPFFVLWCCNCSTTVA